MRAEVPGQVPIPEPASFSFNRGSRQAFGQRCSLVFRVGPPIAGERASAGQRGVYIFFSIYISQRSFNGRSLLALILLVFFV